MPTKTMFQLAPVQLPHSLLREIHCCCGPAPTLPSMSGVGHPAAAGPAAFLMKNDVAEDVHAAEGHGLRDSPLHGAVRRA